MKLFLVICFVQTLRFVEATSCSSCIPLLPCSVPICATGPTTPPTSASVCDQGLLGMSAPGPIAREDCFPRWMDKNKFIRGQQLFTQIYGSIGLMETFSLGGLLGISQMSDVLLFTATNDCPLQANKRYPTTTGNIILWGTANIGVGDNAYVLLKSLKNVRNVHTHAANRTRRVTAANGSLGNQARFNSAPIKDAFWAAMKLDLEAAYTPEQLALSPCYTQGLAGYTPLNQFQYMMTQWSFTAIQTISNVRALIPNAGQDDIDAMNHWWAVVGHMMGIDDQFNIALQPSFELQQEFYQNITNTYVIPSFYNIEHFAKYFMELTVSRGFATNIEAYSILNFTIPNPIPIEGLAMGFLKLILNIEYTNTYAVSPPDAKAFIAGIEFLAGGGAANPLVNPGLNSVAQVQLDGWGNQYFPVCYPVWDALSGVSQCSLASHLHYLYQGPDVNPWGESFNCSSYGHNYTCT